LHGYDVDSVPLIGWAGLKDKVLLQKAEQAYEVLITIDAHMSQENDISKLKLAVVVLRCRSNRLADTSPLIAEVLSLLPTVRPGTVSVVGG